MVPLNPMSRSRRTLITALCLAVSFCLASGAANAKIDPERIEDAQTGWWYLSNVDANQITNLINAENARIIDLEIYSESPLRFTVTFVKNTGTYASGWWWYFGQTAAGVSTLLNNNNARLIDIERYESFGNERFAVVMVPNTGVQQKAWWWYVGVTPTDITNAINANDARLVDIESYDVGGITRYATIMIKNDGEDAAGWGWFHNTDITTITNWMNANNMRMLEFEVTDPTTPRFDAVLVSKNFQPPMTWWWYYNVPFNQIDDLHEQAGARIVDLDKYEIGGTPYYNLVMLNNSSALTVEMAGILEWGSDGDTGVYLREIGGSTLASLQPDFQFEPASTIKVVHGLHAMRDVMAGNITLGTPVSYSENYSGSCPLGGAPITTVSLQETIRRMMVNSDNAATKGIADIYGFGPITNTAQVTALATNTSINHELGCGTDALANPNQLTLRDAGEIYEGIETLTLLNEPLRDTFYSLMQNQATPGPWWFTLDLQDTIDEEAAALGMPQVADSFWAATRTAWKPGGYTLNFSGTNHEYISVAGIVSLPTCQRWPTIVYKDYVFGVFVHDGSNSSDTFNRVQTTAKELFRDAIASALRLCPTDVPDTGPVVAGRMLQPNYPNPFNPSTSLVFQLDREREVTLAVFDAAGRRVALVANETFQPGRHEEKWDGRDDSGRLVPAGVYFARIRAGDKVESLKMALIK